MTERGGRALHWWRAHPTLAAAAIYAVLSLLLVGQGLLPGRALTSSDFLYSSAPWAAQKSDDIPGLGTNFELADAAEVFQPFLAHNRERLPHVPLWNPHIMGGRPYLANAQSAVFSPFSLPSYVLPFWFSLGFVAFLKLWVAAFGTYILARALGQRFGGALLAGVVFAFGTFFVVWLAWPLTSIFALVPWMLLLADRLARRPEPLAAAGLAALVALQYFGGHPESSFHAMFVVVAFFALRLFMRRREERAEARALMRRSGVFLATLVGGTLLAAITIVPFAELLFHSGDLARRLGTQEAGHWPTKYLGALFLHDYWGRPTQSDIEPFMVVRGWYAGAITLMLASAALVLRPTLERLAVAGFALFCAIMVVGFSPLFRLVTALPGFKTAHNERLLIYFLLCLALLAGWGLDELCSRELPARPRRRVLAAVSLGVVLVPVAWLIAARTLTLHGLGSALKVAWGFQHPPLVVFGAPDGGPPGDIIRMSSLLIWLPLAVIGAALVLARLRGRLAPAAFVALAVTLLVADLFRANMGFNPAIPTAHASQPTTPSIRYLQSRRPARFVGVSTQLFNQPLPANSGMYYGLYDARGYDYPAEKRFDRMWRRNVAPGVGDFAQPVELAGATPASLRALSLLSVSDLIESPTDRPLRLPGLRLAYSGPDARVYANRRALPRVFLVGRQRVMNSDDAALAAATAPGFDGRRVAITRRAVPGVLAAAGPVASVGVGTPPGAATVGSARFVSYGDERVTVDAVARRPSILVLTDVHFPGWKARVDGHDVSLERVDYLLRGVALGPGAHRVEMRYEPASWRVGWIVSALALLGLIATTLLGLRARRRRPVGARAAHG